LGFRALELPYKFDTIAIIGAMAWKAMGWNDHIDFELHEAIVDLVDEGYLEEGTPAYGVAQQAIHSGYESLSPKQRYIYDTVMVRGPEKRGDELEARRILETD
jgi:hypothetical protein